MTPTMALRLGALMLFPRFDFQIPLGIVIPFGMDTQTPAPRLTRAERKAETREALLDAAARIFGRRGFHGASVDQVAEEAGFTKGAVYSHFGSKEALFLALLDRHFERRVQEISELLRTQDDLVTQMRDGSREFVRTILAEKDMSLLMMEFWTYAVRNEPLRQQVVARVRRMKAELAELFGERLAHLGVQLPVTLDELALATIVGAHGIAIEKLMDPEGVSDEIFGTMLVYFMKGATT